MKSKEQENLMSLLTSPIKSNVIMALRQLQNYSKTVPDVSRETFLYYLESFEVVYEIYVRVVASAERYFDESFHFIVLFPNGTKEILTMELKWNRQ